MEEKNIKKRFRDGEPVSDSDLPEVKRIREDLLGSFDESDPNPTTQDLESVIKSFEEEISASPSSSSVFVIDLTSESGESQPELGYLLEALDDELGFHPSVESSGAGAKSDFAELIRVDSGDTNVYSDNLWGFDEQIPSYDLFGLGISETFNQGYVEFDDALFEYSDTCFDYSDYSWRLGSIPSE